MNSFVCFFPLLPTGNNSATTELAIIISLSVGLLLLFVLLIFVINRSRKKSQRDRIRNEVVDQAQSKLRVILCFFLSLSMHTINQQIKFKHIQNTIYIRVKIITDKLTVSIYT